MVLAALLVVCAAFTGLPSAAPVLAGGAVPAYDHVFWVVESGQPASAVIGPASYLTTLALGNSLAGAYTAVDASGLADRFALTSGQTFGVGDCLPADCPQSADSLATRVDASGRSWGAYVESMPAPCSLSPATDFAPQRVPFLYDSALAPECGSRVVPYTQLASDLAAAATTPNFVWISPNTSDDMAGSVAQGDSWLLANLPPIFASPAWQTQRSLMVVVFDQPGAGIDLATPVPAVVIASDGSVRHGYQSPVAYDHYSLLATVEASWGLSALSTGDAGASAMPDVFTAPPSPLATPTAPTSYPAPSPSSPVGTPAPTLLPSPTATSSTAPTPGATAEPTPSGTASPSASASPAATQRSTSFPSSVRTPRLATPTVGSNEFSVSNPVLDVVDFTYVGPTTISSGSVASLPVLEFTATSLTASSGSASVPSLSMQSPCSLQNGMSLSQVVAVPGSATADFSGGVTLYVSSIDFTYLGTAYSFTAAAPPASFGPLATGQLTDVAMVAARFSAAQTQLPDLQTVAFFQC